MDLILQFAGAILLGLGHLGVIILASGWGAFRGVQIYLEIQAENEKEKIANAEQKTLRDFIVERDQ